MTGRCVTASVSWVLCDLGAHREEGGEPEPVLEEVGGSAWDAPCCLSSQVVCGRVGANLER